METIINELSKIAGIEAIKCGSWLWVVGDTRPVKEQIKAIDVAGTGFKRVWHHKKQQWFFCPVRSLYSA